MNPEVLIAALGLAALPVGWTLNKVIQHEKQIAVLEQVALDIRNSLQRLEDIFADRHETAPSRFSRQDR